MSTIREIAKAAGCAPMTVSRALRGKVGVSDELRERIQRTAKELGYRPNPLVGAFLSHIRSGRKALPTCNLAMLTAPGLIELNDAYFQGAKPRAAELGYEIEAFSVNDLNGLSHKRLESILVNRGIHGIILVPDLNMARLELSLDWSNFSVVAIGRFAMNLHFHRVCHADFDNLVLCFKKLREHGCKRIGLYLNPWVDEQTRREYSGAWFGLQASLPENERVQAVIRIGEGANTASEIGPMLEKEKPDGLIVQYREVVPELRKLGYHIPQQLQVAHLNVAEDVRSWSGIDRRNSEVAACAVDLLAAAVERNERGFVASPHETLIFGTWREGSTTLIADRRKRRTRVWPFSSAPKAQNPIAQANGLGYNAPTSAA